jgi:aminopeptidase N
MQLVRRPLARPSVFLAVLVLTIVAALPLSAAERPRLRVDDYTIDAELQPKAHKLVAHAKVKFTALEDISVASFELNNALRPTRVLDEAGKPLSAERVSQDSTVRIALPQGLAKDASTTLTFDYEGTLLTADDSPVPGLKLATVNDDTTYLLYAGRWFPMAGYGINRFTATIRITVPAFMTVIGSGKASVESASAPAPAPARGKAPAPSLADMKTYTFVWDKPSFPGTIIAGSFIEGRLNSAGATIKTYFKPIHKDLAQTYADTAGKEFQYFSNLYGAPLSTTLKLVEIPDDTVPSVWAPEIAGLAARTLSDKVNYRLLANTIAHQWWGASVSPASKNDWWLSDGFARYSEALYVENAAGEAGFQEVEKDLQVGALAYDAVPLGSVDRLDTFSPEFQSMVTDKGAMVLNMLRWVMGDDRFFSTLRVFAVKNAGKPASVEAFRSEAEQHYGDQLTWFFTQWLDSTGAPEFKNKYTVYRLGSGKGFRIVGEISQDLDLFRMPVELKVDTDGKTETKRVEVVGTDSPYTVETFGRPRKISIDPDNRLLKNSPDLKVRTAIMRGQQLVEQGDLAEALEQFQKALSINKNSSLAQYRIAEVFFIQRNYQAAANAYRESLNGDGEPKWTEVWSHVRLGNIFDITGQRERATNEYRQALQTQDNTAGAMDDARKYLQNPYQRENKPSDGQD